MNYDPVALGLQVRGRVSGDEVLCLCVFHTESTASLCFNVRTGAWICYGCGARGGPTKIAKATGGDVTWTTKQVISKVLRDTDWRTLLSAPLAFDHPYLRRRRVSNEQVEMFGLRSTSKEILIPLTNLSGEVIGLLSRRTGRSRLRYVTMGDRPPLWPLDQLPSMSKEEGPIVLVEGVFGVLNGWSAGVSTLAVMGAGAANKAIAHLNIIENLLILFDDDFAGYVGAARLIKKHSSAMALLPGGEADELTPTQWEERLAGRRSRRIADLALASGDSTKFINYLKELRGDKY